MGYPCKEHMVPGYPIEYLVAFDIGQESFSLSVMIEPLQRAPSEVAVSFRSMSMPLRIPRHNCCLNDQKNGHLTDPRFPTSLVSF